MNFLYLAPADMFTLYGSVSGSVINATYQTSWLCDGLPGRPVRAGTGSAAWTVTNPSKPVNFYAAINWNIEFGGAISVTGVGPLLVPQWAGRIPYNPFHVSTYAGDLLNTSGITTSSLTVNGSGTSDVVAGEFVAGLARELQRPIWTGGQRSYERFNPLPERAQEGNVAVTRRDLAARTFSGSTVLTLAGKDAVQAWYDSTNDGQIMSVIVPDPLVNDAWAVRFQSFGYAKYGPDLYGVEISLIEYPRKRW